jgi:hypothetical protein
MLVRWNIVYLKLFFVPAFLFATSQSAHADGARTTTVTLVNQSGHVLTLQNVGLEGDWSPHPPSTIAPGAAGRWGSESCGLGKGTEGWANFHLAGVSDPLRLHWDNPFVGDNTYDHVAPAGFAVQYSGGGGDHADVVFIIRATSSAGAGAETTAAPCSWPVPMDLAWDVEDANHLPSDPQWLEQKRCGGTLPDTSQLFPEFGFPFTTQRLSFDTLESCYFCRDESNGRPHGHINWQPVTYSNARIFYHEHSLEPWPIDDDDYNLLLVPDGNNGLVKGDDNMKCEFKAGETVDRFSTTWWSNFRVASDAQEMARAAHTYVPTNPIQTPANSMMDGKEAIVIGLMGLDCVHGCHPELHPVYGLAIHAQDNPEDDEWPIFMRNWGTEGYCGAHLHYLDLPNNRFTIRLPWRDGALDVRVLEQTAYSTNTNRVAGPTYAVIPFVGVEVSFTLPEPEARALLEGEIHLQWIFPPSGKKVTSPDAILKHGTRTPFGARQINLRAGTTADENSSVLVRQLTPDQRALYLAKTPKEETEKPNTILLNGSGSIVRLQSSTMASGGASSTLSADRAMPDQQKLTRVRQQVDALRAAYGGSFPFERAIGLHPLNKAPNKANSKP